MATDPLEALLYREMSIVQATDIIDNDSPLLVELVNHATNAFARCADAASGAENEDAALFALYRHSIEMTDGIQVLVSDCCPGPAIPLVRTSFESVIQMEYILGTEHVNRSLAWLYSYDRERIAGYERLDPQTNRGKEYAEQARTDNVAKRIEMPDPSVVRDELANLRQVLDRDQFGPIDAEWNRLRKAGVKRPAWYGLFDGPRNLRELSRHLDRGAQYEILYRHWSSVAHGADFSKLIRRATVDESFFNKLREPSRLGEITVYAASFLLDATRVMISHFRPGESMEGWYRREVRDRLLTAGRAGLRQSPQA